MEIFYKFLDDFKKLVDKIIPYFKKLKELLKGFFIFLICVFIIAFIITGAAYLWM